MRKIHNFTISGVMGDDTHLVKARANHERLLLQQMHDRGYVPLLDINSEFKITYIERKNQYGFVLTMYGVFVGTQKAKTIVGFSDNKFIPR